MRGSDSEHPGSLALCQGSQRALRAPWARQAVTIVCGSAEFFHLTGSDIYLLRLGADCEPQGSPQRTFEIRDPYFYAAAWTSDGSQIVFSSGSFTSGNLWRIAAFASAQARRLPAASEDVGPLAVSRQGNRLAYVALKYKLSIWSIDLSGPARSPGTPLQYRKPNGSRAAGRARGMTRSGSLNFLSFGV